jgi:hypothetical protein
MDPLEDYLSSKGVDPLELYLQDKGQGTPSQPRDPRFNPNKGMRPDIETYRSTDEGENDFAVDVPGNNLLRAVRRSRAKEEAARGGTEDAVGAVNSVADRFSFGLFGAAMRAGGQLGIPTMGEAGQSIGDYRDAHPILSQATDAPAYLVSGPAQTLFRGAERAVPQVANRLAQAGRAGVTSAITAAPIATAEAAAQGESPVESLKAGGRAALTGLAAGSTLGVGAALAGRAAKGILGSKGAKARKFIEGHGGEVSPGGVKLKGDYETMGTSDADIGIQGAASAKKGLGMLEAEEKTVKGAVGRKIGRISQSPEAGQQVDVSDIVGKMRDAVEDVGTDPAVAAKLEDAIAKVTRKQGADFNPDTDGYFLSETDVNKLKRTLGRGGKSGLSTDEKLNPLREASTRAKELVDQGPFAEANAEYATESRRYQKSRRQLGITERPKTPEASRTTEDAIKNRIIRQGQNSVTAGKQETDMAAFAESHPDIAEELVKPELLRKRADLSFHLGAHGHGGLTDRLLSGMGGPAAAGAAATAAALGHGAPGLGAYLLLQAAHNAQPIAGRLLYRPAQAVGSALPFFLEDVPQLSNPLVAARRSQEQR